MGESPGAKARVLVVDDDEFLRTFLRLTLESSGYETSEASGGTEALGLLAELPVELLLLDLRLPDIPGLEVLERVREAYPKTAVLVITGYASVESAVEAMRMGAYDYVVKPCKPKELLLRVDRMLEKVRLQEAIGRTRSVLRALNQAALFVQNTRTLDSAFQCIGQQMRSIAMDCIVYDQTESSPDQLAIRYLSLPDEQIAELEAALGIQIGALRIPYRDHAFLTETLVHGAAQWHPLQDPFLRVLLPPREEQALHSIRSILGESAFVLVPLRTGGRITGILAALGTRLTDRDVPAMVAFAQQVSVALDNVRWMERISRSERELKELSARLMTIQEEERRRISRDLHDSVGQALTAIKLDLELLAKSACADRADAKTRLEECVRFLGMTMKELRSISTDLRPPILDDLGLIRTLRWYAGMYAAQGAEVTFSEDLDGEPRLGKKAEIAVFRIVQEALSNAVRHGRAKHIMVRVKQAPRAIHIQIEDDGVGFEVNTAMDHLWQIGGLGLVSMRERARLLNAEFRIESNPVQGTRAFLSVPLDVEGGERS